jgi:hypothetical protein
MREARNRNGVAYALTVMAPILPGHEDELREHIESLPVGAASPLARLDTLHFSRIQIFDHLVYQGDGQKPDRLNAAHLVFTSSFDGELSPYLSMLRERIGAEANGWWSHCRGYPGSSDAGAFERWIREHQVHSAMFSVAYPSATVADVRGSLELRERVLEFAAGAQGLEPAELQQRFREAFA